MKTIKINIEKELNKHDNQKAKEIFNYIQEATGSMFIPTKQQKNEILNEVVFLLNSD